MQQIAGIEYEITEEAKSPEKNNGKIPTVICLHGIGANSSLFRAQLDGLQGIRVIAINLPGYGQSPLIDALSFPKLADKIISFMDALALPSAHLCGQSFGGMVAIETACLYPERIDSLALIATTSAFGGNDSDKNTFISDRLKPFDEGETTASLAPKFMSAILGPDISDKARKAATEAMAQVPNDTYRAIVRCVVTFNRGNDVANLTMPVCLIAGDKDIVLPAENLIEISRRLPHAEFHLIERAGHLVNLEKPAESNAILNEFYTRFR